MRLRDKTPNNRMMGMISPVPAHTCLRPSCSWKQHIPLTQKDHQARFYADYRKVAEEYDKEFVKKCDENLSTTLIFVSFTYDDSVNAC